MESICQIPISAGRSYKDSFTFAVRIAKATKLLETYILIDMRDGNIKQSKKAF